MTKFKRLLRRLRAAWYILRGERKIPKIGEWDIKMGIKPLEDLKVSEWCNVRLRVSCDILGGWYLTEIQVFSKDGSLLAETVNKAPMDEVKVRKE